MEEHYMPQFTLAAYRDMLIKALEAGYRFLRFDDPNRFVSEPVCLLRHDVDVDPGAAFQLAEIERDLGIRSTFFFMVRSPCYNLFSRANADLVELILKMGHWLGLHYDAGFKPRAIAELEDDVAQQTAMLTSQFGQTVGVVSFHQPSSEVLSGKISLSKFINTYDKEDLKGFQYVSDSNKKWRHPEPGRMMGEAVYPKLHLLIHPIWWARDRNLPTPDCWDAGLISNFYRNQMQILETEGAFGPPRKIALTRVPATSSPS
jgi:peptidoglycan/xylan/chitin deacetylase (PgdA/CDA1 family)